MFGDPTTPGRLLLGVAGATAVVTISFWALVIGVAAGTSGEPIGAAWALGLALIPAAFMVAAFGSGHDRAAGAVVWALVLSLGVGGVLLVLDPATALIGAYAVGATVTIREDAGTSVGRRLWFALGAATVVAVLIRFATPIGLALAPALPFTAPILADRTGDDRDVQAMSADPSGPEDGQ